MHVQSGGGGETSAKTDMERPLMMLLVPTDTGSVVNDDGKQTAPTVPLPVLFRSHRVLLNRQAGSA